LRGGELEGCFGFVLVEGGLVVLARVREFVFEALDYAF
jgi:hypothetical protein